MKPVRASQPRQEAGLPWILKALLLDDAAAEHDVEEGVVSVDDALRPLDEGGTDTRTSVMLDDGWVDMPSMVVTARTTSKPLLVGI